ncbi:MAG: hypothetical protein JW864_01085 [Spirochaetes bacterium]|nr:hypothetical protein [Spirochaetota bacterium]
MADKKAAAAAVQMIIIGVILQSCSPIIGVLLGLFMGFGAIVVAMLISLAGFILFFLGIKDFRVGFDDENGVKGSQNLFIAAIIGIVAAILGIIPVISILGAIAGLVAFIFMILGYLKLKTSTGYGDDGREGANLLFIGAIVSIIGAIIGFIPIAGTIIAAIISLVCLVLYFMGWTKIKNALQAA